MKQLGYRCYAKVNLTLEVIRRRDDGYHDLASVVHTISLADELHLDFASSLFSHVEGLDIGAETNLVTQAAQLLASTADVSAHAELRLVKRIPAAAGFGGGSSDAATTLVGLNRLWGTHLRTAELRRIAAKLGSDVPFFVSGGAALMTARGQDLETLPPLSGQWLILVAPPPHALGAKTALLYAALEPADFSSGAASERVAIRLRQREPLSEAHLVNVFARAARRVFPGLADAWTAAERICGRRFFLSGAGPALFALAFDRDDAQQQQRGLAESGVAAFAARTVGYARSALRFHPALASGTLNRDPRALCLVVQW
ncbi:MAG: 4-(cytidine 5'-diphospho)-2-C-methyl-D-erythritol kinase [Chloroflexota bacterium]|nr:4-(cytidine 5'-diphospho)-2-C-methyl-D-erythritol kinase [Chloroflexota bacterium]